ncbi:MAG: type III PLP-dependent enzyme [Candidatus Saccharimonas sp.]
MSIDSGFRKSQIRRVKKSLDKGVISMLAQQEKTPSFILNKQAVIDQYKHLCTAMPAIEPHFAIKACPMPELLEIFKSLSSHLDVASEGEIALLRQLDYPPELLIHTHPHKTPRAMKAAYDYGIRTFVLDDLSEMAVMAAYKDSIRVLLRLGFSNDQAEVDLSYKFGLDPDQAVAAIDQLIQEGFTVAGCSFHVGSQMHSAEPYGIALKRTAKIYKEVASVLEYKLTMLDIGGGFPAPYTEPVLEIEAFASVINPIITEHFSDVRVVSEPGRYLSNPCITLASKVISVTIRDGHSWIFADDGVYGSFADMFSGHSKYLVFSEKELHHELALKPYIVAGPTCDSIDIIDPEALLPETHVGDMIIAPNMGAYSYALTSEFNSIPKAYVHVI